MIGVLVAVVVEALDKDNKWYNFDKRMTIILGWLFIGLGRSMDWTVKHAAKILKKIFSKKHRSDTGEPCGD
jgi:hypothetical protein